MPDDESGAPVAKPPAVDTAAIRLTWTDDPNPYHIPVLCDALDAERAKVARLVAAIEALPQEANTVCPTSAYYDGRADGYRWAMGSVQQVLLTFAPKREEAP